MDAHAMKINLLFLHILTIFTTTSSSPPSNFTLYGTAHINQTTITLTQHLTNCTSNPPFPNTGRIFYKHPIRFLDFNSTFSFSTHFSFIIIPPPPHCLSGEGIAFLITSGPHSLPYSIGSIGLPQSIQNSRDYSFLAVEFDTNFDQDLGDINGNHVGMDLDSVLSVASVDLMSIGVDLKSGKPVNSWIEYNSSQKVIEVWVGYNEVKPDNPILAAPMDLSKRFQRFHRFMYVGFSASNGRGSSVHLVKNWEFKTSPESLYPDMEVEEIGSDNCMICFPDIAHDGSGPETETGSTKHNHHTNRTGLNLAIGLLVVNLILVILTVCCVLMYVCMIKNQNPGQILHEHAQICSVQANTNTMPRRYKFSEIRSVTKGFNQNLIIGDGVSAIVYKTDQNIAVKRFKMASFGTQIATEFATMVGSLQHKNLMKLQGWCCDRNELILVYDYMPNGSLDKNLDKLSFKTRLNVLIGVSSALVYLHEECDRLIIHRNVESSNIMLDFDFTPKLGDFGMSGTRDATVPARAMGYLAPEYVYSRVPTVKTDVYSFGVVVLEVASGRPAVDDTGVMVVDWVWDLWEEKRLVDAGDDNLTGEFDRSDIEMVLMVGLICVHPNYQMRPTMKEVLKMLKGEVVPELPEVKPTVMIRSVALETPPEVVVKCGGDDGVTSWGTPTSHFSKG
ncbi:hypothetical protein R6Q59_009521 [Mikania micrantha]